MNDLDSLLDDLVSGDDQRAEAAAEKLGTRGSVALPPLLEMLDATNPDHRWWAVRALTLFNQLEAKNGICRAIKDPDPEVRKCAAISLRQRPTPAAIPALIEAMHDSDRLVARLAGDALAAIGNVAIASLVDAMQAPDTNVRVEATRAMACLRNHQSIPALFAALDDPSPWVTHWAEEGLQRLGVGTLFFKP